MMQPYTNKLLRRFSLFVAVPTRKSVASASKQGRRMDTRSDGQSPLGVYSLFHNRFPGIPRALVRQVAREIEQSPHDAGKDPLGFVLRAAATVVGTQQEECRGEPPSQSAFRDAAVARLEELRILFFAAPLVRRIVLETVDPETCVGKTDVTFGEVKSWLRWQDDVDPLCARIVDLHYFAKLGIKEIALLVHLPSAAVVRELRFARSWVRICLV